MKFSEEQTLKATLHHHTQSDLGEVELRFGGKLGLVAAGGILSKVSMLGRLDGADDALRGRI